MKEGDKYNKLTAIKFIKQKEILTKNQRRKTGLSKEKRYEWLFKCDCGNEKIIYSNAVISGNTKSCGCLIGKNKLASGESAKRSIFTMYLYSANRRKLEFKLSKEEFYDLVKQKCNYCGDIETNTAKSDNGDYTYNGIDRKDNNIGYTIDNCVSCCLICNRAKNTLSTEEFNNWIKKLINNNKKLVN